MAIETIPLETAAERLQSTPLNVLMHIKRGLLSAEEIDGSWQIDAASLERLLSSRATEPRVNVCQSGCAHQCPSCG